MYCLHSCDFHPGTVTLHGEQGARSRGEHTIILLLRIAQLTWNIAPYTIQRGAPSWSSGGHGGSWSSGGHGGSGSLGGHGGSGDSGGHGGTASEAAAPAPVPASPAGALLPPLNFLGESRGSIGHLGELWRHGHLGALWKRGHLGALWRALSRSGLWRRGHSITLSRGWHWRALWRRRHS